MVSIGSWATFVINVDVSPDIMNRYKFHFDFTKVGLELKPLPYIVAF